MSAATDINMNLKGNHLQMDFSTIILKRSVGQCEVYACGGAGQGATTRNSPLFQGVATPPCAATDINMNLKGNHLQMDFSTIMVKGQKIGSNRGFQVEADWRQAQDIYMFTTGGFALWPLQRNEYRY